MSEENSKIIVGQYHPVWLPLTMTWLHRQVTELNPWCNSIILCEKELQSEQFSYPFLYDFSKEPVHRQFWQRLLKKIGIRKSLRFYEMAIRSTGAQLIHSHFGHIGVAGSKLAKSATIPHVVSFYGLDLEQIPRQFPEFRQAYHQMFADSAKVLCEGRFMAGKIAELGCPESKIVVHPLGIDLQNIPFIPRSANDDEPIKILIAAAFREKKGIPLALKAVSGVLQKYEHVGPSDDFDKNSVMSSLRSENDSLPDATPGIRLGQSDEHAGLRRKHKIEVTIVGDATSEETSKREKTKILEIIQSENLTTIVDFKGFLPHQEIFELAKDHHIFLSPSIHASDGDSEGGAPVAIIEMAASGMIIVSSTHCDIPGVVLDRQTGWLAEENSLEDLIKTLDEAISERDTWTEMASKSRAHIEQNFDAKTQAKRLCSIYKEVIGG
ncbi:MAG: glycosyltransferase [Balneolales bacterium]|nr:glycosyltransferase [Balneolales bacterium]